MKIAILSALALSAFAQIRSSGPSETKGTCSPATSGNITTFNFTCSGLTPAQQKLLENMPALLNKLLASQTDNTSEILTKLNACIVQSAPRSISPSQKQRIVAALRNTLGKAEIRIRATNSTAESSRYAGQLQEAFSSIPGWTVPAVFENMVAGSSVPVGLVAVVQNNTNVIGLAIQALFVELGIKIDFGFNPDLPPDLVIMIVGQKPVE